tara:strand:+ start:427 stop:771 length:345 start_codon:yes stop_codon:yes gene_type:complete
MKHNNKKKLKGGVSSNIIGILLLIISIIFGVILYNTYNTSSISNVGCVEQICNNVENLLSPLNLYLDSLLYNNKLTDTMTIKNIVKYIDEATINNNVIIIEPNYYIKIPQAKIT